MEFKKTFFCLGKIREREDQEKGDVHLEAGDQPLKTNPCSSAFFSSQTCGWCTAYLFMAKLLGKFGINNCFFFFHRSDYWDNPACFMLGSPHPTSPFVYLVISPGGIVYKMCCYYTERIWQLPNSLQRISGQKQVPSCSLLFYRNLHLSITDKG